MTLAASAVLTLALADVPATADPKAIPNYQVLKPGLAVAGAPSPEAVAGLKAQGFKTVIDLRGEAEGTAAEKAAVEAQGLRYVHVPVTPASLSLADAEAVGKVLDDPAAGPVLLHCASSNRVGAVLAILEGRSGKPVDEAIAAGRKAGLRSDALVESVRRVLAEAPPAK
jgi:uncharacterized protein (TIGR01244 family)